MADNIGGYLFYFSVSLWLRVQEIWIQWNFIDFNKGVSTTNNLNIKINQVVNSYNLTYF